MSDLVSRALAAIEETERLAQETAAQSGLDWRSEPCDGGGTCEGHVHYGADSGKQRELIACHPHEGGGTYKPVAGFIAHNDPAAVLRRCAADRKLLELHAQVPTHEGSTETGCKLCLWEYSWGCDVQEGVCDTVKIVAEGYGISVEEEMT